ncbi:MAG: FkbM family methyltransferase [Candidatus Omnitrophica bacterium]|nr:FkbM family methyltransferase [Candidatus Omnitrophota bacterium]
MNAQPQTQTDLTVNVVHVGGRAGMGPVESLFALGKNLAVTIFEADISEGDSTWSDYEKFVAEYATRYDVKVAIIPKCLSNQAGKRKFHINAMPESSSLLPTNPESEHYQRFTGYPPSRLVWGEITKPKQTIELSTTTLDQVIRNQEIPVPHLISMDAQGSEYEILEGSSMALNGHLMGVITEVEFRPLYQGQKLFSDQYQLLKNHGFDFIDFLKIEHWYPGPILGKGAASVGEVLFLRNYRYFVRKHAGEKNILLNHLVKLATISLSFNRDSHAFEIMNYIHSCLPQEWAALNQQSADAGLKTLSEFYQTTQAHLAELEKIPTYFQMKANPPIEAKKNPALKLLTTILSVFIHALKKIIPENIRRKMYQFLMSC